MTPAVTRATATVVLALLTVTAPVSGVVAVPAASGPPAGGGGGAAGSGTSTATVPASGEVDRPPVPAGLLSRAHPLEPSPSGTPPSTTAGGSTLQCSPSTLSNGVVAVDLASSGSTYASALRYRGRTLSSGLGVYVFDGEGDRYELRAGATSLSEGSVDGTAACTYRVVRTGDAGGNHPIELTTRVQLRSDAQYVAVNVTAVNTGTNATTLRLPENFIEEGFRVGTVELANKSGFDDYRFVAGGTTRLFDETSYWSTFSVSGSPPSVTAFTPRDGLTLGLLGGTTAVASAMTEDGDRPRQNSDVLTFDVDSVRLDPGERGSWTVAYALHDGGQDARETGSALLGNATATFGADTGALEEYNWTTATDGDADATVVNRTALDFRVYKCSAANATADLGRLSGTLRWSALANVTVTDAFWESSYLRVLEDGEEIARFKFDQTGDGTLIEQREGNVTVDGNVTVVAGIRPTRFCDNGDHADTYLSLRNLTFTIGPGDGNGAGGEPNLTVQATGARATPGENATIDLAFEVGDTALDGVSAQVESGEPVDAGGWPIVAFGAERGGWFEDGRSFGAQGLAPGETFNASFTVAVPEGTAAGDYGIRVDPGYRLNGSSYDLPAIDATVNVTRPGPLALTAEDVTVTPGGETRLNVTVENTAGRPLSDVEVELRGNRSGFGIDGVIAPVGEAEFIGRGWTVDDLAAGRRVEVAFLIGASPERFLEDGFGPRSLTADGSVGGEKVASAPATVDVVEPGPLPALRLDVGFGQARPGRPAGVVEPGERLPVEFTATNADDEAVEATLVVTATPNGWDPGAFTAAAGRWNRNELRLDLPALDPGASTTAGFELSVPPTWNLEGYFTVSAELRVDGRTAADAFAEAQVPGEDGPNERPTAAIGANRTVLGSTVYAGAGDTLVLDGSASRDPDGSIAAYRWDLDGDGTTDATGPTVAATFAQAGETTVTLTVDDGNLTASEELIVRVGNGTADDNATDGGEPDTSNFPPVATATVTPSTVTPGEAVSLTADLSRDRDDTSLTYEWDLDGDGSTDASGRQITTSYATVGNRSVTLTVTDPEGATDTATRTVTVRDAASLPEAEIAVRASEVGRGPRGSVAGGNVTVGETVAFSGLPSTASPAGTGIERYEWTFGDGVTASGVTTSRSFDSPGEYEVTLTVEDDAGRTDTVTRTIRVRPPENVPEVVAVEPLVPGRLLQGLGLENTYYAGVVSDDPLRTVEFRFPSGRTVEGRSVTGRIPFVNGSVYAVSVRVDDLEDGRLRVTAIDDDGDSRGRFYPIEVADTPGYLEPVFRGATLDGNRLFGYVVRGASDVPSPPVGPSFTLTDVRFIGGTYGVGAQASLDAEYHPGANRVTVSKATPKLVAYSPFANADVYKGGAKVSGEFAVGRDRVRFSRIAVTFPARLTTIAQFSPPGTGVTVKLPTVEVPGVGKVKPDPIVVGVGVSLSAGIGGTIEVVSTAPSASTNFLPDGAALGVVVTPTIGASVTVGAGGSVTVYGVKFGLALEGYGGGSVGVPVRVVERGNPQFESTGKIEGSYNVGVRACIALCAETPVITGQPTFTFGGSSQSLGLARPADADAPTAGETRIVPKYGAIPVPALGRGDGRPATLELNAATGTAARLTRDGLADRPASVARGPDGATAVWAGQAPDEPQATGFELYAAERTNGSWSAETRLTNDSRLDIRPDVAAADGDRLAAWSRLTARGVTAGLGGFETVVATRTDAGWTAPTRLTNDSALALNPVVAGADYSGGRRWLVAWLSDADANLSTGDAAIRYAVLDGGLEPVANGTIPGGVSADVAAGPDGFTLGVLYAGDTRGDTGVVRRRIGPNGTIRDRAAFAAANVSTVAAAPGRVAWAGGSGADLRLRVARGGEIRPVPTGNVTRIAALSATAGRGTTTLTYGATTPGRTGTRPVYQARTVEGWTRPRALPLAGNLSIRSLSVADGGRELLAVASAEAGGATRTDVFAVSHRYRPDLRTNATASVTGNASVGDATTVEFAVTNGGERASGPAVVAVRNATGTVATRTVGPLAVGERATGSLTLPLDYTGRVRVVADPGGAIEETDETNNTATAVAVAPDVAVLSATDRRVDGRLAIDVRLRNDATVPVGDVPVRVVVGNRTVDATLRGLGAGRNWTLTVETNASGLGPAAPLDVVVDPADRVPETDESNNRLVGRTLRPDLGVAGGATVVADPQGARAEFVLRNTDTGASTANVTVETAAGERTYRVTVPPARGPRDVVTVPVSLSVPAVAAGGNLTVAVEPAEGLDATLDDNVVRTRVDAVGPADNATARPLAIRNATGALGNGAIRLRVRLHNPGTLTAGEVLTVRPNGSDAVLASEPVAVAPGDGTVTLSVTANATAAEYVLATANDTATVTVLDLPSGDPDGDGLYEDVDGDGSANVIDVAVLLERFDEPAFQRNAGLFDFSGDGRLNIVDVAVLLERV